MNAKNMEDEELERLLCEIPRATNPHMNMFHERNSHANNVDLSSAFANMNIRENGLRVFNESSPQAYNQLRVMELLMSEPRLLRNQELWHGNCVCHGNGSLLGCQHSLPSYGHVKRPYPFEFCPHCQYGKPCYYSLDPSSLQCQPNAMHCQPNSMYCQPNSMCRNAKIWRQNSLLHEPCTALPCDLRSVMLRSEEDYLYSSPRMSGTSPPLNDSNEHHHASSPHLWMKPCSSSLLPNQTSFPENIQTRNGACGVLSSFPEKILAKNGACGIPNPFPEKILNSNVTIVAEKMLTRNGIPSVFPEKMLTRNAACDMSRLKTLNPRPQHWNECGGYVSKRVMSNDCEVGMPVQIDSFGAKFKGLTLDDVKGKIYLLAKDQDGCRFLQKKFEEGFFEDIQKIFVEIVDHIVELMTDPFGNYLVQRFLDVCNEEQRKRIIFNVTRTPRVTINISLNMHGTRSVQKLIEKLKTRDEALMLVSALEPGLVTLIKDLNGNHVVQRCLQCLNKEDKQFLFNAAAKYCVEIATHRHGCCVLQRCIDHSSGFQRDCLVSEIATNGLILSQDQFGNYVVQYVLDLEIPWVTAKVVSQLEGSFVALSMQKFSSNVVEKCLKLSKDEHRAIIVEELFGRSQLRQLLQDPFANYVIQSALAFTKGALHAALVEAIKPHLPALQSSPFGKWILSRKNQKN